MTSQKLVRVEALDMLGRNIHANPRFAWHVLRPTVEVDW